MNKGFEVLQTHYLFEMPLEKIDVVIHPGSFISSMIEYKDGITIMEMAKPEARFHIQYALFYPERKPNGYKGINLAELGF